MVSYSAFGVPVRLVTMNRVSVLWADASIRAMTGARPSRSGRRGKVRGQHRRGAPPPQLLDALPTADEIEAGNGDAFPALDDTDMHDPPDAARYGGSGSDR